MGISLAVFVIFWISLHGCIAEQTCRYVRGQTIPGSCDFSVDDCNYTYTGGWSRNTTLVPLISKGHSDGGYIANGGANPIDGSIVSTAIPAGIFSLSFWYFLATRKSPQLNVSLHTESSQKTIWSLPSDFNVGNWTNVKLKLNSNKGFKIIFTDDIPGFNAIGVDDILLERRDAEAQGSCRFSSQTDTCGYSVQPKWSVAQKVQSSPRINIESFNNDSGFFLWFNSTSKSDGTNQLSTPCIRSGTYCLELLYISFGSLTNITVLLNTTGVLDTLGRIEGQNENWSIMAYNISTKKDFQVLFSPILGPHPRVYVGLDNIIFRRVNNTGDCNLLISSTTSKTKQTVTSKPEITRTTKLRTSPKTTTPTTTSTTTTTPTTTSTTTTPTTTSTTTPTTTSTTTPTTTSTTTTPTTTSTTTPTTTSTSTTPTTTSTTTPTTTSTTTMPTTTSTTTTSTTTTPTTTSTSTTPTTTSTSTTPTTTSTSTTPTTTSTTTTPTTTSTTTTPTTTSTTTTPTTTSTRTTKPTTTSTRTTKPTTTSTTTTPTSTSTTTTTTPTTTSTTITTPTTTSTTATTVTATSTTTTTPTTISTKTTTPASSTTTTKPTSTSTTTTTPTTTSTTTTTPTSTSTTTKKATTTSTTTPSTTSTTVTTPEPSSTTSSTASSTPKYTPTKSKMTASSTTKTSPKLTRNTTKEIVTAPYFWTSKSPQNISAHISKNISSEGTRPLTKTTDAINYTEETISYVTSESKTKFETPKSVSTTSVKIKTSQYISTDKTSRIVIDTTAGDTGLESPQTDSKKSDTPAIIGGVTGGLGALVLILVSLYCYMRYKGRKANVRSYYADDETPPTFDKSGKRNSNDLNMQKISGNGVNTEHSPEYSAMYMQPIDDPTNRYSERSFDNHI